jgi:hypothetical protein
MEDRDVVVSAQIPAGYGIVIRGDAKPGDLQLDTEDEDCADPGLSPSFCWRNVTPDNYGNCAVNFWCLVRRMDEE